MADNVCRNCKWAEWQMTNHAKPRVRKDQFGKCQYPLDRIALPRSLRTEIDRIAGYSVGGNRPVIWFDAEAPCRVWEKRP